MYLRVMGIDRGGYVHKKKSIISDALGDSDRIQTCNLLIRSQMLYSVELRSQFDWLIMNL